MNSKKKKSSNKNLLSVIVPVYNEEEVLPDFLSVLASATKTFKQATEVIFVDDGSSDSSVNILKNYVSKVKNYSLVSLKRNLGQTIALLTGIYQAHGDVIVTIDADLQNDPFDIPHLIDELDKGYDVVCGWRKYRKDNISKKFFSVIACILRRLLTKERLHDMGCTLKAFRKDCFLDLHLFHDMHRYLPTILRFNGFNITEIPVKHYKRTKGKTKYSMKRLYIGFLDLLEISVYFKYREKRFHFFANIIFLLLFFTFLFLGVSLFTKSLFWFVCTILSSQLVIIALMISYHFVFSHIYPSIKTVEQYINYEL